MSNAAACVDICLSAEGRGQTYNNMTCVPTVQHCLVGCLLRGVTSSWHQLILFLPAPAPRAAGEEPDGLVGCWAGPAMFVWGARLSYTRISVSTLLSLRIACSIDLLAGGFCLQMHGTQLFGPCRLSMSGPCIGPAGAARKRWELISSERSYFLSMQRSKTP